MVLAAVCVSCEGGPSLHKESLPGGECVAGNMGGRGG